MFDISILSNYNDTRCFPVTETSGKSIRKIGGREFTAMRKRCLRLKEIGLFTVYSNGSKGGKFGRFGVAKMCGKAENDLIGG